MEEADALLVMVGQLRWDNRRLLNGKYRLTGWPLGGTQDHRYIFWAAQKLRETYKRMKRRNGVSGD